jgi:NitT/TauT family transport system substrate-binding protein
MLGLIVLLQSLVIAVSGPPASPEYLPLRVADVEGYFAREGLTVTLRTTRAEVGAAEALAQGQVDLAATSLEALLRFGPREERQGARLIFGLTAAPPVAILASSSLAGTVRSVGDLAGLRVGVAAPGSPEHTWFGALLTRTGVRLTQVDLVSVGTRGLVAGVETGDIQAGLVPEPFASQLTSEGRATLIADLRTPAAVTQAVGTLTVSAAIFARRDRRPSEADLTGLARALLAAESRLALASAESLASRLPRSVVGVPDEFERRLEASRKLYLSDGWVTADQLRESIAIIRAHLGLPPTLKLPRPDDMLHTGPLKRATQAPRD